MQRKLDISRPTLPVEGIPVGLAFGFQIEKTDPVTKAPQDFADNPHEVVLYYDEEKTDEAVRLTEGSGLTRAGNKITVFVSDPENNLKRGTYYGDLLEKVSGTVTVKHLNLIWITEK